VDKNRVLNHSLTQSPSLFDDPGTEASASEFLTKHKKFHCKIFHNYAKRVSTVTYKFPHIQLTLKEMYVKL